MTMTRTALSACWVAVVALAGVATAEPAPSDDTSNGRSPATQPATRAVARGPGAVALLEDNADSLLPMLTNPTGDPGDGYVEREEVFSGSSAMRIGPLQRFSPKIDGWAYRIVADAQQPGEFRYLRFAWKGRGASGMMIQLHDETNWNVRFYGGLNQFEWEARQVAEKAPAEWTLVTVDLFAEYGARTLQGMALTVFDGQAGFFDHVYLGRTIPDLDRVDATGLRDKGKPPPTLTDDDLNRLWYELIDTDAGKAYRAFWTLVAAPGRSRPFLERRCKPATGQAAAEIGALIDQLEDADWNIRERAMELLRDRIYDAQPQLSKLSQADSNVPPETRQRVAALLKLIDRNEAGADPRTQATRALEYMKPAEDAAAQGKD